MLKIIENKSSFADGSLVKMVKRENNSKRNYLLVNSTQGKHVPCDPENVIKLFAELAGQIAPFCKNKKVLFIGFAETATAVGAGVGSCFPDSYYLHTTREKNDKYDLISEFKEEHSHAIQQLLYCNNWNEISSKTDMIIFVEDEITTGKTIVNFINELKNNNKVSGKTIFAACSILNGMTENRKQELLRSGLEFFWLMCVNAQPSTNDVYTYNDTSVTTADACNYETLDIPGRIDPRAGLPIKQYISACEKLADDIFSKYDFNGMSVAVIGTEECMYPSIYTAKYIEKNSGVQSIVTHSTTRSPIVAENTEDYPLRSRYQVESLYEDSRKTYIYNSDINNYDIVLVITDSLKENIKIDKLINAFAGCGRFILVKWR